MFGVRDTKWLYSNDGRLRKCSDFCFVLFWVFCQLDTNYIQLSGKRNQLRKRLPVGRSVGCLLDCYLIRGGPSPVESVSSPK